MKFIEIGRDTDPQPQEKTLPEVIGNVLFWGGAIAMGLHRATVIVADPQGRGEKNDSVR